MTSRGVASGELQSLVDDLAEQLGRSVVIDDPGIRLICASRHFGDEDPVRVRSVLQRTAGSDVIAYVLARSPGRWTGSGVLPAAADLGLAPRLCAPIRSQGRVLGYLMIIDADATLTTEEIQAAERCARAAAVHLHAEVLLDDAERKVVEPALRDLVAADAGARDAARELMVREGLLRDAAHAVVTLVAVQPGSDPPQRVEAALRAALQVVPHSASARGALDGDQALLLQLRTRGPVPGELREQAERIRATACAMLDTAVPVVGIGGPVAGMRDAWVSRREALLAARAVRRAPEHGGVGVWAELGELAVLVQLPDEALAISGVAEPLLALARHSGGERLRETLRCFLDNGGSIPRTAAALHLHRTSLYYRLGQIRDITGLDLDDGRNRLLLHLGLRLSDLGFPTE